MPEPTGLEPNGHVNLVLVSHSAEIAHGLAELVGQIAGPDVRIVTAGGAVDGSLGTDGGQVLEALRQASAGAGAVVLVDLGSSLLSVRAALTELKVLGVVGVSRRPPKRDARPAPEPQPRLFSE